MSLSLARTAEVHGNEPALIFDEGTLRWAELFARTAEVPRFGDRAVLLARRDVETMVRIYAAIEQGAPLVLLSPRASGAERRAQLQSLEGIALGEPPPLACIFTSGSTGRPRAARLSRQAFAASAEASHEGIPLGPGARWLASMPLSHVGGLSILTRALHAGSAVVVAPEGRWDARAMLARMRMHGVTHASVVPTMLARVLDAQLEPPKTLSTLLVGGAACPVPLALRAREAGWPIRQTYGLTEACSQVATRADGDTDDAPGRIGPPLPRLEVRVVEGRIQIRGPMLFDGYAGTDGAGSLTEDGFFVTGDVGRLDADGVLFVEGRADDMIVTGAENVHPASVEAVLASHPAVRACCVFGVPDREWGQAVAAAVVGDVSEGELDAFVAERASPQARPRRYFFVDALPETASGKVDRARVRRVCLDRP